MNLAAAALAAGAALLAPARGQELQRFEFRQIVMAIEARIVLYAQDEATAKAAASAAFAELDRLDGEFSDYRDDSEVMRLCAMAENGPVTVPTYAAHDYRKDRYHDFDLDTVFVTASRLFTVTDGAFDISVGPLTQLWREARKAGRLPLQSEINAALHKVGRWRVHDLMNDNGGTKLDISPGTRFDLGGLAKGYSIGCALMSCQKLGPKAAMIEMGGDIVVGDAPPDEVGWTIALEDSGHPAPAPFKQCAISTSGDASQGFDVDGVRYSHVIDPHSGWALTNGRQATVMSRAWQHSSGPFEYRICGLYADALATTLCLLPPERARAVAPEFYPAFIRITDPAFHSLFDGKTLAGWTPRGGHYDGDAVWSVEDGQIVGHTGTDESGGLLYTATPHTSFEFQCETKLDYPFDSGIFVRMAPEGRGMQLTLDDRPDGEVGGLYSDGWIEHAHPEAATAWKRGEWNHVFLRCTGFDMHLEAWINGVPVMDRVVPQEFAADGKAAYAPTGLIGLQVHGGGSEGTGNKVRFRDIEVRDLPVFGDEWSTDRALSPPDKEARDAARSKDGWRDLLGGATPLSQWEAVDGDADPRAPTDYAVKDGVLAIPSSQPAGYLRTKADVRDFDLRLEVRQSRMSNSGLFLRGRRESNGADGARVSGGNPAYSGCEIQLLDDWNWETVTKTKLEPWQFTGSLYGAVPPALKELKPIGEWNTLEVLARGSRMACALNGQTIWDVDTSKLSADPPFAKRAEAGFIGLQRYAAPDVEGDTAVSVRGMWLRQS